jgi:hypothetical protein
MVHTAEAGLRQRPGRQRPGPWGWSSLRTRSGKPRAQAGTTCPDRTAHLSEQPPHRHCHTACVPVGCSKHSGRAAPTLSRKSAFRQSGPAWADHVRQCFAKDRQIPASAVPLTRARQLPRPAVPGTHARHIPHPAMAAQSSATPRPAVPRAGYNLGPEPASRYSGLRRTRPFQRSRHPAPALRPRTPRYAHRIRSPADRIRCTARRRNTRSHPAEQRLVQPNRTGCRIMCGGVEPSSHTSSVNLK